MEKALAFSVFSASLYSKAASGQRKDAQAFDCVFPPAILFRRRMAAAPAAQNWLRAKTPSILFDARLILGPFTQSLTHSLTQAPLCPILRNQRTRRRIRCPNTARASK